MRCRDPASASSRSSCSFSIASSVSSPSPVLRSTRLLYYAAILLFNVTLTLPGFAGLILTIGVAADANVVVFERIKEEVRAGKSRAGGDRRRLRQGLPHDPRRERRDGDHGDGHLPDRGRGREGLRPDAPDRYRDLAAHGGGRDARDARPAQRLPLVRQPALHGREGQQTAKWLQIDFMRRRNCWFAHLGRRDPRRRDRARRPRPQPRDRLQGRHADHIQDASGVLAGRTVAKFMASAGPAGRGRPGRRHVAENGDYKQWQIRTKSLTAPSSRTSPRPQDQLRRVRGGRQERLRNVRPPDRDRRDLRDHRLAAPDLDLHHDPVRPEVRDPGDPRDAPRHTHHHRRLLARRARRSRSRRSPPC